MKKIFKIAVLGFAFTSATLFMSCSDAIQENEETQDIEQIEDETNSDSSRHCFSGSGREHIDHDCGHRQNRHGHGSGVCK